ncbi:MAG: NAD(P)/FAD-dependent oxidoreductase [Methanosarcinales archaeon Met12]|nr:MAG: NAD(P)/FAD-dependent oxidoreductase [Methanosarcinales archaeon Met12]
MKYDVIVMGASPAGLMAAWRAARDGAEVLLLEGRESFNSDQSPADTSFDGFFKMIGLEPKKEYIIHRVKGMNIVSPFGTVITIDAPGFSMDRKKFDAHYAEMARDAGAEIKMDSRAISFNGGEVVVKEEGIKKEYERDIVICASGNSEIVKKAGLKTMRHPKDLAYAIQAEIEEVDVDENYFHYFLGKDVAPGWKATISPKGDGKASVGAFVRGAGPKKYFDIFMQRDMFDRSKVLSISHGADQIITMPNEIVGDGLMVVGGAAGQAGIPYGMAAGMLCGEVAAEAVKIGDPSKRFLSKYEKEWKKRFLNHYKAGRFGLKTIEKMSDAELDETMKALKGVNISQVLSKHNTMSMGLLLLWKNPKLIRFAKYLL